MDSFHLCFTLPSFEGWINNGGDFSPELIDVFANMLSTIITAFAFIVFHGNLNPVTSIYFLICSSVFEATALMGGDPDSRYLTILQSVVLFLRDTISLRFVLWLLFEVNLYIKQKTSFISVWRFLDFLFELSLTFYWFWAFIILFVVQSSLFWLLFSLNGIFLYFFLMFIVPFWVILNISLIMHLVELLGFLFFGIPITFTSGFLPHYVLLFKKVMRFLNPSVCVPFLKVIVLSFGTSVIVSLRVLSGLPIEIANIIFVDGRTLSGRRIQHLYLRLALSILFFISYLFFFSFTFFFLFGLISSLFFIGLFIVQFSFGVDFIPLVFFSIFASLLNVIIGSIEFVIELINLEFIKFYNGFVFQLRKFFDPVRGILVVEQDESESIPLDLLSNPRNFTDAQHKALFVYLMDNLLSQVILYVLLVLYLVYSLFKSLRYRVGQILTFPIHVIQAFMISCVPFILPNSFFDILLLSFFHLLRLISKLAPDFLRYLRMFNLSFMFGLSYLHFGGMDVQPPLNSIPREPGDLPKLNQLFVRTWLSLTRRSVIRLIEYLDQLRLPEMVQAMYNPPSLESIRSTYVILKDIGFPVDQSFLDSLDRPEASNYLVEWGSWRNWLLGTSNNALGYSNPPLSTRSWLPKDFFPEIIGYQHSIRIANVFTELSSTARYWTGNDKTTMDDEDLDALIEDTWFAVKPQYDNARLSSFDYIYRNWEKKFNMGFGFFKRDSRGKLKQLTRQAVIETMNGKKNFMEAWKKVFYYSKKLVQPSPVFFKEESLKLKKIVNKSLRTVVGSAFAHHVMTTVFNYLPNHNYQPWVTPSKVGMPINGQNFNKLWLSLAGHAKVFAGDMTAFDSTQAPPLLRVCAEIRKRGFSLHKDYYRICELIDISYDMLISQPMGFKNFGDIAFKGQGATTGHSSTTADNSIMLVANYLYAWRKVTGLRAREFFNYNTLANFGDDHILGYDEVFGWSPQAAMKSMADLGTIMRDEAPGQSWLPFTHSPLPPGVKDWRDASFSFLAKKPLPITPDIAAELKAAGINVPLTFATCHDKDRLLGKIKGEVKLSAARDLKKSYESLLGYMDLCAHHHDIYQALAKQVMGVYNAYTSKLLRERRSVKGIRKPPSYNQVLRTWYKGEVFDPDFEYVDDDHMKDEITVIVSPDLLGYFVRWLSDFPTLLSPRYKNTRWADWLQARLSFALSWPLTFLALSNGLSLDISVTKLLAARTPYAFLRHELLVPLIDERVNYSSLLVRHWLFIGFQRLFFYKKWFSPLDLIRLFDTSFINFLFIISGRVSQTVVELDLHIFETALIFLLNFIHVPFNFEPFLYYIMVPSDIIALLFTKFVNLIMPSGSIDLQPLELAALPALGADPRESFVLVAGTGTGKSTRIVNLIHNTLRRKVVVIVPRASIAVGVSQYMQKLYPESGIFCGCEGYLIPQDFRICYVTVQYFFIHDFLRRTDNIFILDEAHIYEPHYEVLRRFMNQRHLYRIWMTATPTYDLASLKTITLPAVNQFKVFSNSTTVSTLASYVKEVIAFANDRTRFEKVLIFIPTIYLMDEICAGVRHTFCRLNSQERVVDESATVYVSTSVADAGLTIPDVSFVLSPDVDLTVLHNEVESYSVYFKLSAQVIKQRAGRTGRTSNGSFLLFNIKNIETQIVEYTYSDYILSLRPSVQKAIKFFPPDVVADMPVRMHRMLHRIDDPQNDYSGGNWQKFATLCRMFTNYDEEYINKFLEEGDRRRHDFDFKLERFEARLKISEPFTEKNVDPVKALWGDKDPAYYEDYPKQTLTHHPGRSFDKVNVSGEGLLCGARVLIGVYYTHRQVRLSESLVMRLLKNVTDPDLWDEYSDFFEFSQLREVAFRYFKIRLRLIHDGNIFVDPPEFDGVDYPFYIVYLDNNHYNYLGVPYHNANIRDDLFKF